MSASPVNPARQSDPEINSSPNVLICGDATPEAPNKTAPTPDELWQKAQSLIAKIGPAIIEKKEKLQAAQTKLSVAISHVADDGSLTEIIYDGKCKFAVRHPDGLIEVSKDEAIFIDGVPYTPDKTIVPWIEFGSLHCASGLPDDASILDDKSLILEVQRFIHTYADIPVFWEELIARYILMTWVYDCFASLPYLRFLGDFGTGKSRLLAICNALCYKAITVAGNATGAGIFRLATKIRGTLVLDEADYKESNQWSEIVKILNCGYSKGTPVVRCDGENYEPTPQYCYGPKILATRERFSDAALESRCITYQTDVRTIRLDVPLQIPKEFDQRAQVLRNHLLYWRLKNFPVSTVDDSKVRHLHSRLGQIILPILSVSNDEFMPRVLEFLRIYEQEIREESEESIVVQGMRTFSILRADTGHHVMSRDICGVVNQFLENNGSKIPMSNKKVSMILKNRLKLECKRVEQGTRFWIPPGYMKVLYDNYAPWLLVEDDEGKLPLDNNHESSENILPCIKATGIKDREKQ